MRFGLHTFSAIPLAKQVPAPAVAAVECLRIGSVQVLHSGRQIRVRGRDEHVVVRIEHGHCEAAPAEALDGSMHRVHKLPPIAIVADDRRLRDRMDRHVEDRAWFLNVKRTSHWSQCARTASEPPGPGANWCTLVTTVKRSDPFTNHGSAGNRSAAWLRLAKKRLGSALHGFSASRASPCFERKGV